MMNGTAMRKRGVRPRKVRVVWSSRLTPYRKEAAAALRQLSKPMAALRTGWGGFGWLRGRAG
jgi:hypothetical protein